MISASLSRSRHFRAGLRLCHPFGIIGTCEVWGVGRIGDRFPPFGRLRRERMVHPSPALLPGLAMRGERGWRCQGGLRELLPTLRSSQRAQDGAPSFVLGVKGWSTRPPPFYRASRCEASEAGGAGGVEGIASHPSRCSGWGTLICVK